MDRKLKRMGFYEAPTQKLKYFKCIKHKDYPDFKAFVHVDLKYTTVTVNMLKETFERHKKYFEIHKKYLIFSEKAHEIMAYK